MLKTTWETSKKCSKTSFFPSGRKTLDLSIKLTFVHYFCRLNCFEIYSVDAVFDAL